MTLDHDRRTILRLLHVAADLVPDAPGARLVQVEVAARRLVELLREVAAEALVDREVN